MEHNLQRVLQYKTGSQISKLLGQYGREDLKDLKPYDKLTKEQGVEIISIIKDGLSNKGENSKQNLAILYLEDQGVDVETIEPSKEVDKPKTTPKKAKSVVSATSEKRFKEMEARIKEQDKQIEEMHGELKAIRHLLEVDKKS